MKDQTFREITLTDGEIDAALLAHYGVPSSGGTVIWLYKGGAVLRGPVKPPLQSGPLTDGAGVIAGTVDDLPEGEGWVKWIGGRCPDPYFDRVDVGLRDGSRLDNTIADGLDWKHSGGPRDIVAYRMRS